MPVGQASEVCDEYWLGEPGRTRRMNDPGDLLGFFGPIALSKKFGDIEGWPIIL